MQSWLIIGAGYTGGRLATRLAQRGDAVVVTHRHLEQAAAPAFTPGAICQVALDLDQQELPALSAAGGYAVCCAPPGGGAGERETKLIAALRDCAQLIYVSSTGVYAPGKGQWVDEQWPIEPEGELGRARAVAETRLMAAADRVALRWTILRAAGIYGPGRGLVARVRSGEARVIGDGTAHVSRIHVEDLVSAIIAAGDRGVAGVLNCADDDPTPHAVVLDEVARQLGVAAPPRVTPDSVSPAARAMLLADRKISNRRLHRELGIALRFPSWRDAIAAELDGA
jgi:nucleoside-diphosphate-sugar epimerase